MARPRCTSKLHPSTAHNSFLKRIAGKNHSISSGLWDRMPRLTTNESGLSLCLKEGCWSGRGKSYWKEKQRKKEADVLLVPVWNHRIVLMETSVHLWSCQKYPLWPQRPLAVGGRYWMLLFRCYHCCNRAVSFINNFLFASSHWLLRNRHFLQWSYFQWKRQGHYLCI